MPYALLAHVESMQVLGEGSFELPEVRASDLGDTHRILLFVQCLLQLQMPQDRLCGEAWDISIVLSEVLACLIALEHRGH